MREAHLRDFITVTESGGVRSAADRLGISAAAVSRNLAALERECGVPLLLRSNHGIELTDFGRILLRRARTIDSEMRKAKEEIAALSGELGSAVSIGLSPVAEAMLMAPAVAKFRERFPEIGLHLEGGPILSEIGALREGRLDFAIGPIDVERLPTDLKAVRLVSVDLVVVARKGHPLAGCTDPAALAKAQWISGAPPGNFEPVGANSFIAAGLPAPSYVLQRDSFSALLYLLVQTDWISVASVQAIQMFADSGLIDIIPVDLRIPPMVHYLVTPAGRTPTKPARALATEFVRASRRFRR